MELFFTGLYTNLQLPSSSFSSNRLCCKFHTMRCWKCAGPFLTLIGKTFHCNIPKGVGMAVRYLSSGCNGIW